MDEMSDFIKLSEYSDDIQNKTGQVYVQYTSEGNGNKRYMVLLCAALVQYNEAVFFDNEQEAENFAEEWVMR